jgi:hypothetical protein
MLCKSYPIVLAALCLVTYQVCYGENASSATPIRFGPSQYWYDLFIHQCVRLNVLVIGV